MGTLQFIGLCVPFAWPLALVLYGESQYQKGEQRRKQKIVGRKKTRLLLTAALAFGFLVQKQESPVKKIEIVPIREVK